jgi:hypothetical protein
MQNAMRPQIRLGDLNYDPQRIKSLVEEGMVEYTPHRWWRPAPFLTCMKR